MGTAPEPRLPPPSVLPALSPSAARLLALFAREDHRTAEVVEALEADPSISARTLRLANSAYYGFSSRVDTLQRAAVLLGATTLQAVALGTSVLSAWGRAPLPEAVREIWVRAYLCAQGCRFLASRLVRAESRSRPDVLFLAGLLHDIGMILFLAQSPKDYAEALTSFADEDELRRREEELFGWDHRTAGGALLEEWGLPAHLVALVRTQGADRLRAELRPDWIILRAARRAVRGEAAPASADDRDIPAPMLGDLATYLERIQGEAEAFYSAIT